MTPLDTAAAPAGVRRFWDLAESGEGGRHAYASLLGLRTFEAQELVGRVARGLSFSAFLALQRNVGLTREDLARLVRITSRTLARRQEGGRFTPAESDRLLRVARVFGRALELFEGDARGAHEWLSSPAAGLGGATPLSLVDTDIGAREVEHLIGRLEHGVAA